MVCHSDNDAESKLQYQIQSDKTSTNNVSELIKVRCPHGSLLVKTTTILLLTPHLLEQWVTLSAQCDHKEQHQNSYNADVDDLLFYAIEVILKADHPSYMFSQQI